MGNKAIYRDIKHTVEEINSDKSLFLDINSTISPELVSKSTIGYKFSVLSYNILANTYSFFFFLHVRSKYRSFLYRSNIILAELNKLSSDIICLQEVDNFFRFYKKELEALGYELRYAPRESFASDNCVLGFKKELFEILECKTIHFDRGHFFENLYEYRTGNIAIIAKLKHKESGKDVNIVCSHLYWNSKYEHVKYVQVGKLVEYINTHFTSNDIVIWAGDFNFLPTSNSMNYILEDLPPKRSSMEMDDNGTFSKLQEIYQRFPNFTKAISWENSYRNYGLLIDKPAMTFPSFTNYTKDFKGTIDHILYSKQTLQPRRLLKIPDYNDIKETSLPNRRHPSDHLPIMTFFEMV